MTSKKVAITVARGDGIGPEIMDATMRIIEAAGAQIEPEYVNIGEKVVLPQANESQFISNGVVVRVEDNKFLIEDQEVAMGDLVAKLKAYNDGEDAAKKEGLVIVADRNLDYSDLSPLIHAGSAAGFTKYKFAVLRKD